MTGPETPTLDAISKIRDKSQAIGEFLEWLSSEGYHLAKYGGTALMPVCVNPEKLLAEFFGIDEQKAEAERRSLLEWQRSVNSSRKK